MTVEERLRLYKKLKKTDLEIYNYLHGVIYRAEKDKDKATARKWKHLMEQYRFKVYKKRK